MSYENKKALKILSWSAAAALACSLGAAQDAAPPSVDLAVGENVYPASSDAPAHYQAEVDLRLPRGLLATGDAAQAEGTIRQLTAASGSAGLASPEPLIIRQGQTIAQVEQLLGKPLILTMASKMVYVYRDLKITFTNGTVTDVQ